MTRRVLHIPADLNVDSRVLDVDEASEQTDPYTISRQLIGDDPTIARVTILHRGPNEHISLYVDEDGFLKHLPYNARATYLLQCVGGLDALVGDVILIQERIVTDTIVAEDLLDNYVATFVNAMRAV